MTVERKPAEAVARLRDLVDAGGGPAEVARQAHMPISTLVGYLRGGEMKFSRAAAIAAATGASLDWLATGQGPRMRGELPPAPPAPTAEDLHDIANHAMKEMLPAEMTQEDRDDLLQVTVLAERYLDKTMPGYLPDQLIITATNFFSAMRKYPGSRAEQYRRFMADLKKPEPDTTKG